MKKLIIKHIPSLVGINKNGSEIHNDNQRGEVWAETDDCIIHRTVFEFTNNTIFDCINEAIQKTLNEIKSIKRN